MAYGQASVPPAARLGATEERLVAGAEAVPRCRGSDWPRTRHYVEVRRTAADSDSGTECLAAPWRPEGRGRALRLGLQRLEEGLSLGREWYGDRGLSRRQVRAGRSRSGYVAPYSTPPWPQEEKHVVFETGQVGHALIGATWRRTAAGSQPTVRSIGPSRAPAVPSRRRRRIPERCPGPARRASPP
jgi:hypothetical protein